MFEMEWPSQVAIGQQREPCESFLATAIKPVADAIRGSFHSRLNRKKRVSLQET
jgi:hypothetical protein